ncbi:FAD-dependent oxidoreductase [Spirosoma sp. BT702]|uniref:FAD-dependent oxidoreductase n=1 Tax=Spirosoma profusum TaxID=2771354 RepID=A0A926XWD4_9BACT|nr:NAD(P)/FAD-dependent oxidoreductase [Spirosoma profusum]MBD2701275.1 FAD-dependent oxidoreductase [Spirosoma profusum]
MPTDLPESLDLPVVIVGAGVAGLACAVYLKQAGIDALLLEADEAVGGRIRTDVVDGFQLDRGFQILLTAYPEAQRLLKYSALDLKCFRSGALIRHQPPGNPAGWRTLLNPAREPSSVFKMIGSPVGSFNDKVLLLELLRQTQSLTLDELFRQTPATTLDFLDEFGFSDSIIEQFFRPFFGGVFLEDALTTSSNFFSFCFRMFFEGDAALPARGIGAIPEQLASGLNPNHIWLNSPVQRLDGKTATLVSGKTISANTIVLAVDAAQAARLTGRPTPTEQAFNHTTCTYFAADAAQLILSPKQRKLLMLNTHRSSSVHNVAIVSDIAPTYAPAEKSLISVSTQQLELVDEKTLTAQIRQELAGWFGSEVQTWQYLRTYHIPHALPAYSPEQAGTDSLRQPLKLAENLYQCGDQMTYPSLNAALKTGREVAEMIVDSR